VVGGAKGGEELQVYLPVQASLQHLHERWRHRYQRPCHNKRTCPLQISLGEMLDGADIPERTEDFTGLHCRAIHGEINVIGDRPDCKIRALAVKRSP
jgi:hypothetical protein